MKYRTDFVTNSSSSSYIIAYQQTTNYDEETLKKYPALACFNSLIDMVMTASGSYEDTSVGYKVSTKDELDRYFADCYVWGERTLDDFLSDDKWCKEKYDQCLDAIQNGFSVIFKSIDYSDIALANLIDKLGECNTGVKIIDSSRE